MTRTVKSVFVLIGIFCVLNTFMPKATDGQTLDEETRIKAVWAATVFSLDYPAKPSADSEWLKADIDAMVEKTRAMGYNTLFFQVRPAADAFYASDIFPWSQYLTGEQGKAPENGFDPLQYAVSKAHENGIKIHAWINPYRITASAGDKERQSENSIVKKYPELIVEHSDGKLYLNPGEPQSNQLVIDGAVEIVRKYDVDGIHIDDYFYPGSSFPDGEAFAKYGGKFSDIGDWRRDNITALIRELKTALKAEDDEIIFSVSPCGIWANAESMSGGSETKGKQAYFDYYADTRLWVKENLVDWMIPQIYWNIGYELADFEKLANWWNDAAEGTDVEICIGQAIYKVAEEVNTDSVWYSQSGIAELNRQTDILRGLDNVCGYAHYRLGSLDENELLADYTTWVNSGKKSIFTDTKAYPWAEDAIEKLYDKGIVKGMGDGTFGCARTVSRADFMVMLMRMLDKDVDFADNFEDVTADKYYYKEIGMAKKLGYTEGRDGKIFDPAGNISRQDMAVMAYRIMRSENMIDAGDENALSDKFSDFENISGYAKTAVAAMVDEGYLNGYETGEFKPEGNATRAETAVFLNKILSKFEVK